MRGVTRTGVLITILLVLVGWLLGTQIATFYYSYYDILGLMEAQAKKASVFNDAQIRRTLVKRIKKLELPVENPESAVKIERFHGKIILELKYEELLFVDFGEDRVYDLWVFKFHPRVEQRI
jgi:hypothetical protein